jgi:hypothetical protein
VFNITNRLSLTLYRKIVVYLFETFNTDSVVTYNTIGMNRVIVWLQKIHLQQMAISFLVGVTWLVSLVLWQSNFPAQAAPMTSEIGYQVNQPVNQSRGLSERTPSQPENGAIESIQDVADNIREKLNLDQPLPESTKDFFKQVQGEDVVVEEPRPSGK